MSFCWSSRAERTSPTDVAAELRCLLNDVILDPPATGLTEEMRRVIVDPPPKTMIYVSCNPPTLARDLAELHQRFAIVSVTPFDMFPQTAEIEAVVRLQRGDNSAF
jgi:tRNA/tmRNA/rRNA uracil-C5-methylase (TrmA/RlmC/RlmD family)